MANVEGNAKLFAKIAQIMARVRTLEKTGVNKYDNYQYVTADAIATRIGSAMAEAGVAFFPSMISAETSEYTTQKGGNNFRTVVHMQMTLACSETGATWTSDWFGEAIDRSDKSISKAAVSAAKYYLLKTFLLAGGDDEDTDASSPAVDERATPKRVAALQPRAPQSNVHSAPPVDNPWGGDTPWYARLWESLPSDTMALLRKMRALHVEDNRPCSPAQYQYLSGLLNSIAGIGDEGHSVVLSVICLTAITGDNRPSFELAQKLLDYLPTHIKVEGKKVENPNYRADIVEHLKRVASAWQPEPV